MENKTVFKGEIDNHVYLVQVDFNNAWIAVYIQRLDIEERAYWEKIPEIDKRYKSTIIKVLLLACSSQAS